MVLFPVYIRALGGTMASVSYMWIWMILLEIPLVAFADRIFRRIGPRTMVALATIAAGLRWTVCGFSSDLSVIYPVQLLHGMVITGLLVAAPLYIECLIPERLRSTGQGLLTMVGPSIGGILSTTVGGWLMDAFGPDAPYLIGGLGALGMACLAPVLLPPVSATSEKPFPKTPR